MAKDIGIEAEWRLRALREYRKVSQSELAREAGVSLRTVRRAEHGDEPSGWVKARLARALATQPEKIWTSFDHAELDPNAPAGERIRRSRERAGMSSAELARDAEISEETMRRIERGDVARPQDRTIGRIAEILSLEPTVLWDDFEEPRDVSEQDLRELFGDDL